MGEDKRIKIVPDIDIESEEPILPEDVLMDIIDMLLAGLNVEENYERGYKSYNRYEPDEPASLELNIWAFLGLPKLQERYIITKETVALIEDAFDNLDCYEEAEASLEDAIREEIPSYISLGGITISVKFSTKRNGFYLTADVDDYDFDDRERTEYYMPEPDPYESRWDD